MTMEQILAEITDHDIDTQSIYVMVAHHGLWRVQKIGRQWLYVHNNAGQIKRIGPDEVVEIRM